jgi:hypothetical protein
MTSCVRPACLALAFVATAVPASAQTWVYEPDTPRARVYEPRSYEPRGYEPVYESRGYEPRAYEPRVYEPRTYEPDTRGVVGRPPPLALTPAQRTTIYRTIIPQGRGRGPIVKERIVSESVAPAPVVGERVVTQPAVADYTVGTRVRDAYALAPMPQAVVATVPNVRSYRYMVINNRLLLVDPATGYVVADMTE